MSRLKYPCALALLAATTFSGILTAAEPETKRAATPEEAIKLLVEAAKAGDVDGFHAHLATPLATIDRLLLDVGAGETALHAALDQKFGTGSRSRRLFYTAEHRQAGLRSLSDIRVLAKVSMGPNAAVLSIWETKTYEDGDRHITETKVVAVKEGEAWKLYYQRIMGSRNGEFVVKPGPDGRDVSVWVEEIPQPMLAVTNVDKSLARLRAFCTMAKEAFADITRQVQEDRFKTREETDQAVIAALPGFAR